MDQDIINTYNKESDKLIKQYESKTFEQVHEYALPYILERPSTVLEIGAGSGRDAAWFASRGHQVVAVEPAQDLLNKAKVLHPSSNITWVDDSLPALEKTVSLNLAFDLIWLSAVWMHLPEAERERAFRKLSGMLRSGGRIMISLRHGSPPEGRKVYQASVDELVGYARHRGLQDLCIQKTDDTYDRDGVWWQTVILHRPDNGTEGLPLLRHITLNDGKSSTYKLALLRCLVRIADSSTGLAQYDDPEYVTIPLGLVALYWIRQYKPLLDHGFPQAPTSGLGFVKEPFKALSIKPDLLKSGTNLSGVEADHLRLALRDAAKTIAQMPSRYITYPGSKDQVFLTKYGKMPSVGGYTISKEMLWHYGELKIPINIWQSMTQYAVWIEPALIQEWIALMRRYEHPSPSSYDKHIEALQWIEPEHDTKQVRGLVDLIRSSGLSVRCVWKDTKLTDTYEVDHCFPFVHWPCNDLWNLMPSSSTVNGKKSNKLPTVEALQKARTKIIGWWELAYLSDSELKAQFYQEASSTLPGLDSTPSLEDVFEALLFQQVRIQSSQQLISWMP